MQQASSKAPNDRDWRNTIRESKESEPLKFKLLSMLGLKEYLIDKYVFLRSEPRTAYNSQSTRSWNDRAGRSSSAKTLLNIQRSTAWR